MKKTVVVSRAPKRTTTLRIANSSADAWQGAAQQWFEEASREAWKRELPSVVIVPTRSHANALRGRLLEQNVSHLGLRFVTPMTLRGLLLDAAETPAAAREDLRLLLGVAAEQTLADKDDDDLDDEGRAAKAVVRAPAHLWQTLERLASAGWSFDQLRLGSFQPIVTRFREHLKQTGLELLADADRL
ncbi:MAG: hypothetical protein ABR526_12885, partial [Chthoniobacterales bacterium]